MKTKLILLFSALLITLGSINSCKKDYPKDIPDWLKEMIKERKKECKEFKKDGGCCGTYSGCWNINEYKKNDQTYFVKILPAGYGTPEVVTVYSHDGQVYCGPKVLSIPSNFYSVCDSIFSSEFIRNVWSQE